MEYKKIPKTVFTIYIQIWFKRHPELNFKKTTRRGVGHADKTGKNTHCKKEKRESIKVVTLTYLSGQHLLCRLQIITRN